MADPQLIGASAIAVSKTASAAASPVAIGPGTNAGLLVLATYALGPVLGEYFVIILMGFIGTLVMISEVETHSWAHSAGLMLKGVAFSFVFTGILTSVVIQYIPSDLGITPYAILGTIAFVIGWVSNKMEVVKTLIVNGFSNLTAIFTKKEGPKP